MTTPRDRLRQAMIEAGFSTPTEAYNRHKKLFSQSAITSALNGHRPISVKAAEKFGQAFNVDPVWILYGGDGLRRPGLEISDFGELLLRTSALPDREARRLFQALSERFASEPHQGSPADDPAANEATAQLRQRKRS